MSDWLPQFDTKCLRAAKVLLAKDWSNPKVILAARHMANDGLTVSEIKIALGWAITDEAARYRLKKFGINPFSKRKRTHRGEWPYLSKTNLGKNGIFDMRSFKPSRRHGP